VNWQLGISPTPIHSPRTSNQTAEATISVAAVLGAARRNPPAIRISLPESPVDDHPLAESKRLRNGVPGPVFITRFGPQPEKTRIGAIEMRSK